MMPVPSGARLSALIECNPPMKTVTPTAMTNDKLNRQNRPKLAGRWMKVKKIACISQVVGFRFLVRQNFHKAEAACLVKALAEHPFYGRRKQDKSRKIQTGRRLIHLPDRRPFL